MEKKLIMLIIFTIIYVHYVHLADAIQEKNLNWSSGDVYTMTPSSNMITQGNYTIKTIDFPAPVRGMLSVNDTIIPENPVTLAVTIELYKDIINNPNPIATFTLRPGDEYITSAQDMRITIDSMPGDEDSAWVYESYNPSVNIRMQKIAIPNLDIQISFTNTNGDSIDNLNPGDVFLVNIKFQNTGEDIIKDLSYNIVPDSRLQSTSLENKLRDTIPQLNVNDEFTNQIKLVASSAMEQRTYEIDVNATGHDIRDILYYWNNSETIFANGSLELLELNKTTAKTTVYLKENIHVILTVYNRGSIEIKNIKLDDPIPVDLKYIKDNTELDNLSEVSYKIDSIGADQSWTTDYFLKPVMPGIYVLPVFTANFTMSGKVFTNQSNEVGFRVYGPIIQLNKTVISHGNNVFEMLISANNIGNGPSTVIIDDRMPYGAVLLEGNNHTSIFLNAKEEKSFNYTISLPKSGMVNIKDLPPANATYYLGDYKFTTSSLENVLATPVPPGPSENKQVPIVTVPVPTIKETEKKVVATIPATVISTPVEKKSPGFEFASLIGIFILFSLLKIVKRR